MPRRSRMRLFIRGRSPSVQAQCGHSCRLLQSSIWDWAQSVMVHFSAFSEWGVFWVSSFYRGLAEDSCSTISFPCPLSCFRWYSLPCPISGTFHYWPVPCSSQVFRGFLFLLRSWPHFNQ